MTPWHFRFLGYKLGFAQPAFLLGVLGAVLVGVAAVAVTLIHHRRRSLAVPVRFAQLLMPGVSLRLRVLRGISTAFALGFFALALSQPQCGARAEVSKRRGIDIVVAIDASKSMYARDVPPSRLDRAKLELTALLDALKGDRVAIIAFAGDAFIQCPLTGDYAAAKLFLRAIHPKDMPQGGTNIGAALRLSRKILEKGTQDKVLVLLSDGEDFSGAIDEGVAALQEVGVRVLAVGIGGEVGAPVPAFDSRGKPAGYQKDAQGKTILTRLDRAGLARIASETGGELFYQPAGVAMENVLQVVDTLQKDELESRLVVKYGEAFQPFVAIGLVFLTFGILLVPSWRKKS